MKRSEMLKKLANDIYCIRSTKSEEATDLELANILLDHIEEYGMEPPYDSASDDEYPEYRWYPE